MGACALHFCKPDAISRRSTDAPRRRYSLNRSRSADVLTPEPSVHPVEDAIRIVVDQPMGS